MKSRLVVLLFFAIALATVAGREPHSQENTDVKVDVDLVRMDALVLDKSKQPVTNLTKDDFSIFENNAEQEIKYLNKYSAGILVIIAIDVSSSMGSKSLDEDYRNYMPAARQAGLEILKHLSAEDEVSLVLFNERILSASKFTSDFEEMGKTISEIKEANGRTDIHLGVMEAAEKLARKNSPKRGVIFLISDNQASMKAQIPPEQILQLVTKKSIVFYSVPVTNPERDDPNSAAGLALIYKLVETTGGGTIDVRDVTEKKGPLDKIFQQLRDSYALFYALPNKGWRGKRKIRVILKPSPDNREYKLIVNRKSYSIP